MCLPGSRSCKRGAGAAQAGTSHFQKNCDQRCRGGAGWHEPRSEELRPEVQGRRRLGRAAIRRTATRGAGAAQAGTSHGQKNCDQRCRGGAGWDEPRSEELRPEVQGRRRLGQATVRRTATRGAGASQAGTSHGEKNCDQRCRDGAGWDEPRSEELRPEEQGRCRLGRATVRRTATRGAGTAQAGTSHGQKNCDQRCREGAGWDEPRSEELRPEVRDGAGWDEPRSEELRPEVQGRRRLGRATVRRTATRGAGTVQAGTSHGQKNCDQRCRDGAGWDEPRSEELRPRWREDLPELANIKIPRGFQPETLGKVEKHELHHFSDASMTGYGQCSYLRLVDDANNVHCSLVMGKARVTPLRVVTIPRLELQAAMVSVKVSTLLHQELEYEDVSEYFWTVSKVVLGYI